MEGKDGDKQLEKDAKRNWWFSLLVRIPGVKDPKDSQEGAQMRSYNTKIQDFK